jgi:hypothetical protein
MKIISFCSVLVPTLVISLTLGGCATSGKATLLGTGMGSMLGSGVGALVDAGPKGKNRIRNVFIGATAGGLLGAGVGYLAHEAVESKEKDSYERGKEEAKKSSREYQGGSGEPVLIPARVEAVFVEDQLRGNNVFVPAHYEYRIVEPARWAR